MPECHFVYDDPQCNLYCPQCGYVERASDIKDPGKCLHRCKRCPDPIALVEWRYINESERLLRNG